MSELKANLEIKEAIEVSLGNEGGTHVFDSLQGLTDWLEKEQAFWSWLRSDSWTPLGNEKNQILNHVNTTFYNPVSQQLSRARTIKERPQQKDSEMNLKECFDAIIATFKDYFENKHGIYSASPKGKFLEKLRTEQGEAVMVMACGFMFRLSWNFNSLNGQLGALSAFLFESGLKDRATSEKLSLEEMRLSWQGVFQAFEKDLKSESEKHKQLNSDAGTLLDTQKQNFDKLVAAIKEEWQKLKTTYDAELAIRAPVLYWKQKAKSHLALSWVFAVLSIAVGGTIIFLIFREVKELITAPAGIANADQWHPEYWRLGILVASVLFGVWIVRIIVRLFLSNVHLHTDAKERIVMVQTYLALIRRAKISKEDERLILETLFRPAKTGIMKDDGVPLTALDALSKLGR